MPTINDYRGTPTHPIPVSVVDWNSQNVIHQLHGKLLVVDDVKKSGPFAGLSKGKTVVILEPIETALALVADTFSPQIRQNVRHATGKEVEEVLPSYFADNAAGYIAQLLQHVSDKQGIGFRDIEVLGRVGAVNEFYPDDRGVIQIDFVVPMKASEAKRFREGFEEDILAPMFEATDKPGHFRTKQERERKKPGGTRITIYIPDEVLPVQRVNPPGLPPVLEEAEDDGRSLPQSPTMPMTPRPGEVHVDPNDGRMAGPPPVRAKKYPVREAMVDGDTVVYDDEGAYNDEGRRKIYSGDGGYLTTDGHRKPPPPVPMEQRAVDDLDFDFGFDEE